MSETLADGVFYNSKELGLTSFNTIRTTTSSTAVTRTIKTLFRGDDRLL